jgi:hypothetical protein
MRRNNITYSHVHLLLHLPLFHRLFALPLHATELLRSAMRSFRLLGLLCFSECSCFLRFCLFVRCGFPFPCQLTHTINDGEMSVLPSSFHTYWCCCGSSPWLPRRLALLLLLLLLLGLELGKDDLICLLQSGLVGAEVLSLGHLGR